MTLQFGVELILRLIPLIIRRIFEMRNEYFLLEEFIIEIPQCFPIDRNAISVKRL